MSRPASDRSVEGHHSVSHQSRRVQGIDRLYNGIINARPICSRGWCARLVGAGKTGSWVDVSGCREMARTCRIRLRPSRRPSRRSRRSRRPRARSRCRRPQHLHLLAAAAAALGLGLLAGLLGVASHRRRVRVSKSGFAGRVRVACEGSERAKTRAGAGSSPELPPFADRMPDGRSKGGDFVAPLLKLPIRSLKYKCGIVGFLIINV